MNNKIRFVKWAALISISLVIADIAWQDAKQSDEPFALCSLHGKLELGKGFKGEEAPESAKAVVRLISSAVGIPAMTFTILQSVDVRGHVAAAFILGRERLIVFDPDEFRWGNGVVRWRDIVVIAHEIFHHLGGGTIPPIQNSHDEELEADYFSGYVVALLGGTLEQALSSTARFQEQDGPTHPGRAKRVQATTEGWRWGEEVKARDGLVCKPQWLGEELLLNDRACRVARVCSSGKADIGLLCRGEDGQWNWQRENS